jgi:hypothetical protein
LERCQCSSENNPRIRIWERRKRIKTVIRVLLLVHLSRESFLCISPVSCGIRNGKRDGQKKKRKKKKYGGVDSRWMDGWVDLQNLPQRVYPSTLYLPGTHIAFHLHLNRSINLVHELTLSLSILNSSSYLQLQHEHNANPTSCTDLTFEPIIRKSSSSPNAIICFFTYA